MPITLVGPNPAQPFDIQTQQAQLAQAQQLALAMLQQELGPTAPTIRTAAGNPFGRDVVNLAPLGNIGAAFLTRKHLGSINEQQQALADKYLQQYKEGVEQVFSPSMPSGAPSVMGTQQPSMLESAKRAIGYPDPRIQALGASLLASIAKGEEARQVTAPAVASLARNVLPSSIKTEPGAFGFPMLNIGALRPKPIETNLSPGMMPALTDIEAGVTKPSGAANLLPSRTEGEASAPNALPAVAPPAAAPAAAPAIVPKGKGSAPVDAWKSVAAPPVPMQISPTGEKTPIPGPALDAIKAAREEKQADASDSYKIALNFITNDRVRYENLIKLAQMAQAHNITGSFGDQLNEARKLAVRVFGFSADDANKITNYETMMKLALTPAAHAGRQEVGGRYTQLEFMQFLKAGAAAGMTDPRTAQIIFMNQLVNNLTHIEEHNKYVLPKLASVPGAKQSGALEALTLPTTSQALAEKILPTLEPMRGSQHMEVTFDPSTGTWRNIGEATPMSPVGAGPTKLPGGFTLEQ